MYELTLPYKPSLLLRIAFHLLNDQMMWAFCQGIHQASEEHSRLATENAALRQQVSKRDSSGRFAPKNTGQ